MSTAAPIAHRADARHPTRRRFDRPWFSDWIKSANGIASLVVLVVAATLGIMTPIIGNAIARAQDREYDAKTYMTKDEGKTMEERLNARIGEAITAAKSADVSAQTAAKESAATRAVIETFLETR